MKIPHRLAATTRQAAAALVAALSLLCAAGADADTARDRWHGDKYSMFIHFGLYSKLGGVWQGKPVTFGYSEQIQSHAGIYSDWYAQVAGDFDPVNFNADSIAALAKAAGMRSIILTSKHHDGFCMFDTKTTDYNSAYAMPGGRDFVKEIAEACRKAGLKFGLYFSVIDWHFPHAYPISSHNCDQVTPQHHEYSKAQVTELLTKYGPVSELWFDMGSNTPEQSREMYELVKNLQPDCMVSGRLGNDYYDFSVMADNAYPDGTLVTPWQSAASMFDETWSYRSWQERGSAGKKAATHLRNLISVVSHGGNFLLNIGPDDKGDVVPFEAEVLGKIGRWLEANGDAIYDTEATPFREDFTWGKVTRKGPNLYLLLSGTAPADGKIVLPGMGADKVVSSSAPWRRKGKDIVVDVPASAFADSVSVVRMVFRDDITPRSYPGGTRVGNYSYSCNDYSTNYQSTVSYDWYLDRPCRSIVLTYTPQEEDAVLDISSAGDTTTVTLEGGTPVRLPGTDGLVWGKRHTALIADTWFEGASTTRLDSTMAPRNTPWKVVFEDFTETKSAERDSYYMLWNVTSPDSRDILLDITAGNGVELYVNGRLRLKHLNPYRTVIRTETVLVHLDKGLNTIVLKSYNRFEKKAVAGMKPSPGQTLLTSRIALPKAAKGKINIRRHGLPSVNTDTELSNISLTAK